MKGSIEKPLRFKEFVNRVPATRRQESTACRIAVATNKFETFKITLCKNVILLRNNNFNINFPQNNKIDII